MDPSQQAACTHKENTTNKQGSKITSTEESTQPQPDTRTAMDENADKTPSDSSQQKTVVEEGAVKTEPTDRAIKTKDDNGMIFYTCRFCGLTFNYMTTLRAHERVHNIDQPYKCNKCSQVFHFMCELEYHAKQHSDQKGYKCECGRTFHNYTDLLYHKHPGEDEEDTVVEERPAVLLRPGQRIPETDFPVPAFVEKGYEPKHPLKLYSDVRTKPYICQYCSKSYVDSRGLSHHMSSHRGERAFTAGSSRYLMGRSNYSYISPVV